MNTRHLHGRDMRPAMCSFFRVIQKAVSLCLLFALLALPLGPVWADESTTTESIATPTPTPTPTPVDVPVADISATEVPENASSTVAQESNEVTPETETAVLTEASSTDDVRTETDASSSDGVPLETEDRISSEDVTQPTSDSGSLPKVTEEELVSDEDTEDSATSTGTSTETVPVVVNSLTNNDNQFSFSKSECTVVGDGSYYCAKSKEVPIVTDTDRIFSATDKQGDKEIFVEHDGTIAQLTNNDFEDDAPYYDEKSNTIVWHRLIDGRYQIMSYSFKTNEETQLTHDAYNNMEPSRFGDVTVWQAWINNNWEIMLLEGDTLKQLTTSTEADIAPSVNDDYIVWQSQEHGIWYAKVYDRNSGEIQSIENKEGLSIENARFVLVYDTRHENGDIETRGYDLKNKREIPLSSTPAPAPAQLPEPDGTKEKRALIQTPTQIKTKTDGDTTASGGPAGDDPNPDTGVTATTTNASSSDIIVPTATSSVIQTSTITASSSTEHIPELIVEPVATDTPQIPAHIEDLIVQPLSSSTQGSLDSQGEVASST